MSKHHKNKSQEASDELKDNSPFNENTAEGPDTEAQGLSEDDKLTAESDSTVEPNDYKKKYEEMNDKYLRLYSEFDNYRRRVSKEKLDLSKTASEDIITSLLPVLDDFERAISMFGDKDLEDPIKQGVILIFNKFKSLLVQKGLEDSESLGKEFDTDFHEAIAHIPAPDKGLKNKVLDVTQKGYMLNGKLIRFAKVVVGS